MSIGMRLQRASDEAFLALIAVARENRKEREKILSILQLAPIARKIAINQLVLEMRRAGAPVGFIHAWDSLQDDSRAERLEDILVNEALGNATKRRSLYAAFSVGIGLVLYIYFFLSGR